MQGPTVTRNLVMNVRGIEMLEDAAAWGAATAAYVAEHFETEANADAVTISIEVRRQKSSNEGLNELINARRGRRRRGLRGGAGRDGEGRAWRTPRALLRRLPLLGTYWEDEAEDDDDEAEEERLRRLQSKSVEIAYDQTSTWTTADPAKYDAVYICTDGFNSRSGSESYQRALKAVSPYYGAVTSVGSIRVNPPPDGIPIDGRLYGIFAPEKSFLDKLFGDDMEKSTQVGIFSGICVGGSLCLGLLGFLGIRRRRRNKRRKLEEEADSAIAGDLDDSLSVGDLEGEGAKRGKRRGMFGRRKKGTKDDETDGDDETKKKKKGKKSKRGKDDSDDSSGGDDSGSEEDGGRGKRRKKGKGEEDRKDKKKDKGKGKSPEEKKKKKSKRERDDSDDSSSDDEDGGSDEEGGRGKKTRKGQRKDEGKGRSLEKKKKKKSRGGKGDSDDSDDSSSGDDEEGGGRGGTNHRGKGKKRDEKMDKEKRSKRRKEKSKRGESDSDDSSVDEEQGGKGKKQSQSRGTDDEEEGSGRGGHKSRGDRKGKENKEKKSKIGNEGRKPRRRLSDSYDPWSDEEEGGRNDPYKNKFRGMEDSYNSRSGRSFHDSWSLGEGERERSRYHKSKSDGYAKRPPRPGTTSGRRRRKTAASHSLQYDWSRSESLRKGARKGPRRRKERDHSQSDHQLRYGDPDDHILPQSRTPGDYWQANEGPGPRKALSNEARNWDGPSTVRTASLTKSTSRVDIDSMLHGIPALLPRLHMGPSPSSSVTRIVHVIAPTGKLGLVMDAAPDGTTCVCEVKNDSPILGKLLPEDKIIAIDNEDVQMMNAAGISKMLAQKCQQPQRMITVLREVEVQALTWRDSDLDVDAHFDDLSSFGSGMNNSAMSAMF